MLAGAGTLLTECSHTRTSSTLQPSSTSQRNSPPSILETTYPRLTRSSGNTLRRSTRTPIRASRVAGRTGGYQPCRPHLLIPHHTPRWHRTPCIEVTRDRTSKTAVTAAAGTLPCPLTQAYTAPNTTTTSTHLSTPTTNNKSQATMTWSSLSARCTSHLGSTYTLRDSTIIQRAHGGGVSRSWQDAGTAITGRHGYQASAARVNNFFHIQCPIVVFSNCICLSFPFLRHNITRTFSTYMSIM
jgi:hypothetical protein